MTNVEKLEGTRAPMGQLIRVRQYPTAAFRDVTAPNADTLYVTAWIDVTAEPWVLSPPDAHDRYYLPVHRERLSTRAINCLLFASRRGGYGRYCCNNADLSTERHQRLTGKL
jgi:hypothetical protein